MLCLHEKLRLLLEMHIKKLCFPQANLAFFRFPCLWSPVSRETIERGLLSHYVSFRETVGKVTCFFSENLGAAFPCVKTKTLGLKLVIAP